MSQPQDPAPKPRWDTLPGTPAGGNEDQRVFDTVAGPNLRLRDNLIQLAVIVAGTALGAGVGAAVASSQGGDPRGGALAGGFGGVVVSLLLSGFVLGLVRFILALRSK